ncbi:MAG: preprotein translocase subunit YajC [Planctomycetes bacterium]|nr:preprotein translocase subunit YajC [Planctomycetota bacterium]
MFLLSSILLLAEDAPAPSLFSGNMLLPFLAIGVLFYFLMIRPQRRQKRQQQDMLGAMKKNDRVVTIGGIKGTIANIQREADEVTLKIDESSGAKIRVQISAIARVITDGDDGEKKSTE